MLKPEILKKGDKSYFFHYQKGHHLILQKVEVIRIEGGGIFYEVKITGNPFILPKGFLLHVYKQGQEASIETDRVFSEERVHEYMLSIGKPILIDILSGIK